MHLIEKVITELQLTYPLNKANDWLIFLRNGLKAILACVWLKSLTFQIYNRSIIVNYYYATYERLHKFHSQEFVKIVLWLLLIKAFSQIFHGNMLENRITKYIECCRKFSEQIHISVASMNSNWIINVKMFLIITLFRARYPSIWHPDYRSSNKVFLPVIFLIIYSWERNVSPND